jgi:hypothetical protein
MVDGKCAVCGFDKIYISFLKCYRKCNCGTGIKCEICGKQLKRNDSIGPHLKNIHNTNMYDYSEKYLRPVIGKLCKVCNKPTNLKSLLGGYHEHCSKECVNKSKPVRTKARATTNKNFGVDCLLNTDELKINKYKNSGLSDDEIEYLNNNKNLYLEYRKICGQINQDKKLKTIILESQNNLDFYTNDIITSRKTIDHKIPIVFGFVKKIPTQLMNSRANLCVTSDVNNSTKSSFTFEHLKLRLIKKLNDVKFNKISKESLKFFINVCEKEMNHNIYENRNKN